MASMAYPATLGQQMILHRSRELPDVPLWRRVRIAGMLFLVLLLQIWIRVEIIQAGYRLEEVRTAALKQDAQLRELKFEYAAKASPSVVRDRAQKELGLRPMLPQAIRKVIVEESW